MPTKSSRRRGRHGGKSNPAASAKERAQTPSAGTLRGLDGLNFFLANVQTGIGPFLAISLAANSWNEQRVGMALTVGGVAGILTQTPAGELVDRFRPKRSLVAAGVAALAAGALLIVLLVGYDSSIQES
jgi:MFS family permease